MTNDHFQLSLILRKRGWDESGAPKRDCPAEPFARVQIEDVGLSIVSKELYVSTVRYSIFGWRERREGLSKIV